MNSKKRDRLEVIFDILKIVRDHNNSITLTPLLRQCNLSSTRFYSYYAELLAKDFVKEVVNPKDKKYITLTDKGFNYLEKYKTILGLITELDL
jgi:predicted transcriptional regulator